MTDTITVEKDTDGKYKIVKNPLDIGIYLR